MQNNILVNNNSNIISGRDSAATMLLELANKISKIKAQQNKVPTLAIILVGEDPASIIYIKNKLKAAINIGIEAIKVALPTAISQQELLMVINKLNNDAKISGIIVQLPLPAHIDTHIILASISPCKDVDGFHPVNVGLLNSGVQGGFVPSTALGVLALIKYCLPDLVGKSVAIIGRSNIVGKPLAALLLSEDCTVTICHSKTQDLHKITARSEIVVSAIGKPKYLGKKFFNVNSVVIDVGISRDPNSRKIVGDVDFAAVKHLVKYITPVPGGVGPMTIACLLDNTFKAFVKNQQSTAPYE